MSGKFKTRKVTEMGRLVTRAQLQSAANQIGAHILKGMQKLEDAHDERLRRIEKALGLSGVDRFGNERTEIQTKPALVERTLELLDASCAPPKSEVEAFEAKMAEKDQPKEIA